MKQLKSTIDVAASILSGMQAEPDFKYVPSAVKRKKRGTTKPAHRKSASKKMRKIQSASRRKNR